MDEIEDSDQFLNEFGKNDQEIKRDDAGEPMQIQGCLLKHEKGDKIIWTGKNIPNMRYVLKDDDSLDI